MGDGTEPGVPVKQLEPGPDKGVTPPDWYVNASGSFTIRTRHATSVIRGKNEGSTLPFDVMDSHKEREYEPQNPELETGEVVISEHGTDREEKYEVEA